MSGGVIRERIKVARGQVATCKFTMQCAPQQSSEGFWHDKYQYSLPTNSKFLEYHIGTKAFVKFLGNMFFDVSVWLQIPEWSHLKILCGQCLLEEF